MIQKIYLLILLCLVSACVTPVATNIKFENRSTLSFSGKGAAAGMMMDTYLGGTGVAIGIAIDEGIAKDISKNISSRPGGFDMLELVRKEIIIELRGLNKKQKQTVAATKIVIENYGFHSASGDGDKVSAWLKMRFVGGNNEVVLNYPDDFTSPTTIEFSDAKTNPDLAFNTLKNATDLVLDKWLSTIK